MPKRKINQLDPKTIAVTDLLAVADPVTGVAGKATVQELKDAVGIGQADWLEADPVEADYIKGRGQLFDRAVISAATYTIQPADINATLRFSNAGTITVTVPSGLLVGFNLLLVQEGLGQIVLTNAGGVTLQSSGNELKSARQFAVLGLFVKALNIIHITGEKAS